MPKETLQADMNVISPKNSLNPGHGEIPTQPPQPPLGPPPRDDFSIA